MALGEYSEKQKQEDAARCWRNADLSYKLAAHQLRAYQHQREWEKKPITAASGEEKIGAARWYVDDWGRRIGKTYTKGVTLTVNGLSFPNARMIYGTKTEIQMKEILVPTLRSICADAPRDTYGGIRYAPEFFTSKWGMRAGFYFPSSDSVLKLVGLDKDPDGMRGTHLDWCAISEAAFIKDLRALVVSIIGPQFMRRPHARGYLESSAPEDTDHDFDAFFVPDAKRRGAYWFYTFADIDNEALRAEAELEYQQAAEIDKEAADREYKGIRSRNFASTVFPEFNRESHVQDVAVPSHAVCITADDPGYRHLYGKVWAFYDFDNARLVVQDSWAGSNSSSTRSACVSAAREFYLWGTWPPHAMRNIPLESDGETIGWTEYLSGDRCEKLADDLCRMANVPADQRPDYERRPGAWILNDVPDHLTYWNGVEHKKNPHARVSDVDLRLIRDMGDLFGLDFLATTKEELRVMVNLVRNWLGDGRLVFLPTAGPVIEHVNACKWHKDRRHFDEHRVYGHYDAASCIVYLVRYAQQIELMRPYPPSRAREYGQDVQSRLPWEPRERFEIELNRRVEESKRMKPARNMLRQR